MYNTGIQYIRNVINHKFTTKRLFSSDQILLLLVEALPGNLCQQIFQSMD
jgi:hypothetical protein